MKITFLSHSTLLLELHNKKLLIDPFLSDNPLFDKNILKTYLNKINIDYILITHAHYDHVCDVELFYRYNKNSLIISNYEISNFFYSKKIKTYGMNFGSFVNFPFGKLKYVWASHSSSFKNGIFGGNPGGFLLHSDEGNIYISGDTSLTKEMCTIPNFGKLNISILPIGGRFTMDVKDALIATEYLKCNKVIGVHYNTFDSILINKEKSKNIFYKHYKNLILMNSNTSINI